MTRAPRYHASGDCIHADPLSVVCPEGRTFSVYSSDSIEMHGLISAGRNGLVFYDNDREVFLNRPLFTDILSSHPTPTQLAIINEFSRISTWKSLRDFFIKLDKILVIEQFKQYLSDQEADRARHYFVTRAAHFCEEENIPLRQAELAAENGFYRLASAIGAANVLKNGLFREAIPDLLQEGPDSLLAKSAKTKRAERWLAVAGRAGELPGQVGETAGGKGRQSQPGLLRETVAKYMHEIEAWENSPLMTLGGAGISRRDAEEYLFDAHTAYCPSPLGFTPRIRFAFPAPEALAGEPLEVKIAFVHALETKLRRLLGFPVKILYMQDRHCFLLESIGDSKGSEISLAYSDGAEFERNILFASGESLISMTRAVDALTATTAPEFAERDISEARLYIASQRECLADGQELDAAQDNDMNEPDEDSPREEM